MRRRSLRTGINVCFIGMLVLCISLLAVISVAGAGEWTNSGADNRWQTPDNWDTGAVTGHAPEKKDRAVINRSGEHRAGLTRSVHIKTLRVGNRIGVSGELDIHADLRIEQRPRIGMGRGKGIVNQHSGTVHVSNRDLAIGQGGSGTRGMWNLNGGSLIIARGTVVVSNGIMNITGGVLRTRTGPLRIGAGGTFRVAGSDIKDIGIGSRNDPDGSWRQSGTFRADVGPGGVTTTRVDGGGVTFKEGARLEVGFLKGSERTGSWDVMTWDGDLTGGDHLKFAKTVDTDTWDFSFVDTDDDGTPDTLRVRAGRTK